MWAFGGNGILPVQQVKKSVAVVMVHSQKLVKGIASFEQFLAALGMTRR